MCRVRVGEYETSQFGNSRDVFCYAFDLESRAFKFVVPLFSLPIAGSIPPELGKLAALEYLSLSGNQLTGEIVQWFMFEA